MASGMEAPNEAQQSFESGHTDMVHDAAFDYYGRRLATCASDRLIKVFEVVGAGGPQEDAAHTHLADLAGHEGPVWQVAWSHPKFGSLLASCSFDHRVIVWKEVQGSGWTQIYRTPANLHTASINSVCWAPHELGLILACGSSDGTISIIEHKPTGEWDVAKIDGAHAIGCTAVSWAPAIPSGALVASKTPEAVHKRLVSGGCDNTVKIWKHGANAWELDHDLRGHGDWVRDVAWAPNLGLPMSTIASCSQDGKVLVWQEQPGGGWEPRLVHDFRVPLWRVSWSLTGSILAVSDANNGVTVWKETLDGRWQQIHSV